MMEGVIYMETYITRSNHMDPRMPPHASGAFQPKVVRYPGLDADARSNFEKVKNCDAQMHLIRICIDFGVGNSSPHEALARSREPRCKRRKDPFAFARWGHSRERARHILLCSNASDQRNASLMDDGCPSRESPSDLALLKS